MRVAKVFAIAVAAMGIGAVGVTAPVKAGEAEKPGPLAPEQQERLDLMKSKGMEASLTILPVRLGGKTSDRVTEVVGLLLERQGLKHIELGKAVFEPATKTDLQALAASAGEFVKGRPIATEYVLYAEINGSPETVFARSLPTRRVQSSGPIARRRRTKRSKLPDRTSPCPCVSCWSSG